jgi:4a-hydroxytetrahydrobiopterin dehydratase
VNPLADLKRNIKMDVALNKKHCVPCEDPNMPPLDTIAIKNYLKELGNNWQSIEDKKIEKTFPFINFKAAIAFINEIADIAEYEGHHPDIFLHNFNKVIISLSTHAIKGLSENDFIVAAKIDTIEIGF